MHFVSHIGQDRWVCEVLKYKRDGFFLDFGGFEGLLHSNTYYLEKFLNWRGILVEPNPVPYASACAVRSCITVNAALWKTSRESIEFCDAHGLSSFKEYRDLDQNSELRSRITKRVFNVDTINPTELLERFNAPTLIDYMSLDVEGAEVDVLEALDLSKFKIALMSIEHNHVVIKKNKIRRILSDLGYIAIEHRNDDLFFHPDITSSLTKNSYDDPFICQSNVLNNYRLVEY